MMTPLMIAGDRPPRYGYYDDTSDDRGGQAPALRFVDRL